jgi:hypothetical protein
MPSPSTVRCCRLCGASLEGKRSHARFCTPAHRAEAARLRRILSAAEPGKYPSVHHRLIALESAHGWATVAEAA